MAFTKEWVRSPLTKLTEFPTDRGLGFVDQIPQRYPPNVDKTLHLHPSDYTNKIRVPAITWIGFYKKENSQRLQAYLVLKL